MIAGLIASVFRQLGHGEDQLFLAFKLEKPPSTAQTQKKFIRQNRLADKIISPMFKSLDSGVLLSTENDDIGIANFGCANCVNKFVSIHSRHTKIGDNKTNFRMFLKCC